MTEAWVGIHKCQEEMGELGTVLGKLCVVPTGVHWDERETRSDDSPGAKPLKERLIEEAADVLASVEYLVFENLSLEDREKVFARKALKTTLYQLWRLTGVKLA